MDIQDIRREYLRAGLRRRDLDQNPYTQFERWLQQAMDAGISDPTAMVLSTVDQYHRPSQRIVLLKQFSEQGLVFFTNKGSLKAQNIASNANVSLHFPWHIIERQIHVAGTASALNFNEVEAYFHSRPKESQLAAWASNQSQPLANREELIANYERLKEQFEEDVPVPDFWGGYRVLPERFEFWQGGEHRLHDRFIYECQGGTPESPWSIQRLSP